MRRVYGIKSVEPGVAKALCQQNHLLEEYFEGFEFKDNPQDEKEDPKIGVIISQETSNLLKIFIFRCTVAMWKGCWQD